MSSGLYMPRGYRAVENKSPVPGDRAMTKVQMGAWLANSPCTVEKSIGPNNFIVRMGDETKHITCRRDLVFIAKDGWHRLAE